MQYVLALLLIIAVIAIIIHFRVFFIALAVLGLAAAAVIKYFKAKKSESDDKTEIRKQNLIEFLLCLFFGWAGGHKFYRGNKRLGIVYLLTLGLLCIGWWGDLIQLCMAYFGKNSEAAPSLKRKISSYTAALLCVLVLGSCSSGKSSDKPSTDPTMETTIATEVATEESTVPATTSEPTETIIPTEETTESTEASTEPETLVQETTEATEPMEEMVWIPTNGGTKYHRRSSCSNMEDPQQVPLSQAIAMGFTPCKRCH